MNRRLSFRRAATGNKNNSVLLLISSFALAITFFSSGCTPKLVVMSSPYERYDHNRTQKIIITSSDWTDRILTRAVIDEVYIPSGSSYFPTAQYAEGDIKTDSLPAADVVPIFTGVPLPLSNASVIEGRSDREDIIDFLAEGPYAKTAVQPSETIGDTGSAEITYKPILDFLSSKEHLAGGRKQIIERLSSLDVDFADEVIDSRYSLSSFQDVLAFRYDKFWFILYKLPDSNSFS